MITTTKLERARCIASWGNHGLFRHPDIETDNGSFTAEYLRKVGRPLCGDFVDCTRNKQNQWHVTAIHECNNHFARGDKRGDKQLIAVNLDQVAIVVAAEPEPSKLLIDRYLVAAELCGIKPLIVHNKIDLGVKSARLEDKLEQATALDYTVLQVSARTGSGMDKLRENLQNHCTLMTGQSGVGKSSLINTLIPDLELQTKAISKVTGKGTHTTSTSRLYQLAIPGEIIDSPGVWEYGLWKMEPNQLASGINPISNYINDCKFNNCKHITEPGCRIRELFFNSVSYSIYLSLLDEIKRHQS